MALIWLLSVQAAAAAPAAPPPAGQAIERIDFDLATVTSSAEAGCKAAQGDADADVVVCGRRRGGGDYPYEEMARRYESGPMDAEVGIGGNARLGAYVDSVEMPGGHVSKRAMIGVKIGF